MKKFLKWLGFVVLGLIAVLVFALLYVNFAFDREMARQYRVAETLSVPLPTDPNEIAEGKRLAQLTGCIHCHGENLEGGAAIDIHPNLVHQLLEQVPATGWQLRQESADAITVLLTGQPSDRDASMLQCRLADLLQSRGAAPQRLDLRWVAELPRGASGKAPLIVALPS